LAASFVCGDARCQLFAFNIFRFGDILLSRWQLHNAGGSVLSVTSWHRGREIESFNVRFQP